MASKCVAIAMAWLLIQEVGAAQQESTTFSERPSSTDEVLVRASRLRDLKVAVAEAEDRFYERYNELNKVDDFDIQCRIDSHTGTRIPQRRCFPKLLLKATSQQGEEALRMFQDHPKPSGGMPGFPAPEPPAGMSGAGSLSSTNPEALWLARFNDYRDNMLYLLKMHPDLRRLSKEGEDTRKRYEAEYLRRMKGRLASNEE